MTIFDTLKYQISDKPTQEELAKLPNDLWVCWLGSPHRRELHKSSVDGIIINLDYSVALRKFISEWNNDDI